MGDRIECEHGRLKRVCPLCELQDELGLALTEVGRLEAQLAALREENAELRAKAIIWHKWPEEKPGERGWYLGGFIHPTYFDFMKLFYSDGHFNDDSLDYWVEIPRPEES